MFIDILDALMMIAGAITVISIMLIITLLIWREIIVGVIRFLKYKE